MGGTDKDVKEYFFSLSPDQLDEILAEYGREYGASKQEYARDTMGDWKSGRRKMSGLVAKRLFDLLPPRMPVRKKFELAENIWQHFGPSSRHHFAVGPDAPLSAVVDYVSAALDKQVTEYNIPENVKNRFNWLSQDDVGLKEQLLNHFRQLEKNLARAKLETEVPVLQRQVRENTHTTGSARSVLQINKHEFSVWIDPKLTTEVKEGQPVQPAYSRGSSMPWGWIIAALVAGLLIILKMQ